MRQAGFNLIELVVSMAIGLVLMLSLTSVFVDTKVASKKTTDVTNLQQQAQLALQVLLEDVANIGSWAAFSGEPLSAITTPASLNISGCNLASASGASATNVPKDANWISDENAVLSGCMESNHKLATDSDVLSLARIQGALIERGDLQTDKYYLATSPQKAQLFLGQHWEQVETMNNADLYPYVRRAYFVDAGHEQQAIPKLRRFSLQAKQLISDMSIDNIEKFKVDFGIDSVADGKIDQYKSSDDMLPSDWQGSKILSARIHVLARADHPDFSFNNNLKYNERYLPFNVTSNDHYRRLLLSTTVNIKNNKMVTLQ